MRRLVVACALASGLASAACGTSRQSGICGDVSPAPSGSGDVAALDKQAEEAWALRGDEAKAAAAIQAWSDALKVEPSRADLRVKLAHAHYFLADSLLWVHKNIGNSDAAGDQMVQHYREAANHAELALGQKYPAFRSKYCARQPFSTALEQLDKDAVPAMYWYAAALSRWALNTSLIEVLNQSDRIRAMMELTKRLDPTYWYYASDRYLGGFYTKIPYPAGDLEKSRKHFENAIQNAPQYLATRVVYAEMNASKAGDKPLFKRLLEEVLAFDLKSAPELEPENAAEQKKAKYYLDDIDNLVSE